MPKYRVRLFVLQSHYYTVEAETEEAAYANARERFANDEEGYVDKFDMRVHDHDVESMED